MWDLMHSGLSVSEACSVVVQAERSRAKTESPLAAVLRVCEGNAGAFEGVGRVWRGVALRSARGPVELELAA